MDNTFKNSLTLIFLFICFIVKSQSMDFDKHKIRVKFVPKDRAILQKADNTFKTKPSYQKETGIRSVDSLDNLHHIAQLKHTFHCSKTNFQKRHEKYGLDLWYEITLEEEVTPALIEEYKRNPHFSEVELIYEKKLMDDGEIIPMNDSFFSYQWAFHNTAQVDGALEGADISLLEAWQEETGSEDVIVAVLDGGIDVDHIDLADAMWVNEAELNGIEGVDDDNNGYIDDIHGYNFVTNSSIVPSEHGTHVAGIVGAVNNNGRGISSVAGGNGVQKGVRIMACQVFSDAGGISNFADAMVYSADNGAVISQNSWGGSAVVRSVMDAINYFIENAGIDENGNQTGPMKGGVVVFGAGNENSGAYTFPASYAPTIAVAGTGPSDQKANYSNFGDWVDISAPGGDNNFGTRGGIVSTLINNRYGFTSGTSMAAPQVSGVAALIVSKYGGDGFTNEQLKKKLLKNVDSIDQYNSGYEGKLGAGRLNAYKCLINDEKISDPINDLVGTLFNEGIELSWTATGEYDSQGSADEYDIRFSTEPITEENFYDASEIEQSITPKSAGNQESFSVTDIITETTYYFAIKSINQYGNISTISNTIAMNLQTPSFTLDKNELSVTLDVGDTKTEELNISNTGQVPFSFYLDYTYDGSEYEWISNANEDLVQFEWIDIEENKIDIKDNFTLFYTLQEETFKIDLPFEFSLYGNTYSEMLISSRGNLYLNNDNNNDMSTYLAPLGQITSAISERTSISYAVIEDQLVVEYKDLLRDFFFDEGYSFQIILNKSGFIKYQYGFILENEDILNFGIGNDSKQMEIDKALLVNNSAFLIYPSNPYIQSINTSATTLDVGESATIEITYEAGDDAFIHTNFVTLMIDHPFAANKLIQTELEMVDPLASVFGNNLSTSSITFSAYPNPSSDGIINIKLPTNDTYEWTLVDSKLRTVIPKQALNSQSGESAQLELSKVEKGMYYLIISNEENKSAAQSILIH